MAVGDFSGNPTLPDIAVLNSGNNTIEFFLDESTGTGNFTFQAVTPHLTGGTSFPSNLVAMTSGFVSGGAFPDLILATNNPNHNSLWVLENQSTPGPEAVSFLATPIADSGFAGTPVGVATGMLSTGGAAPIQDIAVVYAAAGTNESMVAVFRNLGTNLIFEGRDFGFQRTAVPGLTGGDYVAGAAFTGSLTKGSNSVKGVSTTAGLFAGAPVTGTGVPAGTTIQTIDSATATITLSANATVDHRRRPSPPGRPIPRRSPWPISPGEPGTTSS